jgi:hypothetical protein
MPEIKKPGTETHAFENFVNISGNLLLFMLSVNPDFYFVSPSPVISDSISKPDATPEPVLQKYNPSLIRI